MGYNTEDMMNMLSEYQEGDISEVGKAQLLDEAVDLLHALREDSIVDGWKYDEIVMLIEEDAPLPNPGDVLEAKSALTNTAYTTEVKYITGLTRNSNGKLLVRFLGKKRTRQE